MDAQYRDVNGVTFESALTLLTTVLSVRDGWAVLDAGRKSLKRLASPAIGCARKIETRWGIERRLGPTAIGHAREHEHLVSFRAEHRRCVVEEPPTILVVTLGSP
jgi:D-serine deaminase-like pyridoxal phosphate-dependent protein